MTHADRARIGDLLVEQLPPHTAFLLILMPTTIESVGMLSNITNPSLIRDIAQAVVDQPMSEGVWIPQATRGPSR